MNKHEYIAKIRKKRFRKVLDEKLIKKEDGNENTTIRE